MEDSNKKNKYEKALGLSSTGILVIGIVHVLTTFRVEGIPYGILMFLTGVPFALCLLLYMLTPAKNKVRPKYLKTVRIFTFTGLAIVTIYTIIRYFIAIS